MKREDCRICGECMFHKPDPFGDDWVCQNDRSDWWGYETEYDDSCEEWTPRSAVLQAAATFLLLIIASGLGNHFIDGL